MKANTRALDGITITPESVRSLRAALGMTAAEFAAAVGSTPRSVERWMQGVRTPRGPALVLLRQLQAEAEGPRPKRKR